MYQQINVPQRGTSTIPTLATSSITDTESFIFSKKKQASENVFTFYDVS